MPRPLHVFLCHASQDKPAVWKLHRYLKQRGTQPWLDQEELLPGQNWAVEISKAIDASDVILVCLSKASINKEGFVQKEISFALDRALEKPEGMIFIIPVRLEACELPRNLNWYHWVDLFSDGGRRRLLMSLNRRATELGEDVSPVLMEDTKQRTPKPFKPEFKPAEQVVLNPEKEEVKEELKKEFTAKPFTRFLDPSTLAPSTLAPKAITDSQGMKKFVPNNNLRWLGISGIVIIGLLMVLFGGNYLRKNFVVAPTISPTTTSQVPITTTPAQSSTITFAPPIFTLPPYIGLTVVSEKDGMVLVYVPAGTFIMGSDSSGLSDEKPEHKVSLDAFWIDQTEVTNAMYAKCVAANQCDQPNDSKSYTHPNYYGNSEFDHYPVVYVSWNDAVAYCSWAGRRLPTEAEWEKAARGTDGNIYPWGNDSPSESLLNYNQNVGGLTAVGKYPRGASIYGVYDMAGNVWEWVSSLYQPYPYDADNGRENLSSSGARVLRGGSWNNSVSDVRSAFRFRYDPTNWYGGFGFRCSRSP